MKDVPPPDRIDVNFWLATGAFIATSKPGEVLEARDIYIANSGIPMVDYNLVFLKRPGYKDAAALDRVAHYFEDKKLPYRVAVRTDQADACRAELEGRGFLENVPVPGMALAPLPDAPPAPEGLEIRRVEGGEALAHFQETAFAGFGLPTAAAPLYLTEQFLGLDGVSLFVGYVEGEPACTSALVHTAKVAGIYWVATLEPFRGRGYGEAVTWWAVEAGRAAGCDVASLQASDLGQPVYVRMGFTNDRDYARFDFMSV